MTDVIAKTTHFHKADEETWEVDSKEKIYTAYQSE